MASFSRYFNVAARVQLPTVPVPTIINTISGEGLRIQWEATRMNTRNADTGVVRIYNLAPAIREQLQNIATFPNPFGSIVVLSLGWDGVVFEAIRGALWKISPAIRENQTDVVTEIEFGDGLVERRDGLTATIAAKDAGWVELINLVVSQMGLTLDPSAATVINSSQVVLTGLSVTYTPEATAKDNLNFLISSLGGDYDWGIIDNRVVIYKAGLLLSNIPPIVLAPNSGLLDAVIEDDGAIRVAALGDPSVRPGQQAQVSTINIGDPTQIAQNPQALFGGGPVRVESVTWRGDTDVDSTMDVLCRKVAPL